MRVRIAQRVPALLERVREIAPAARWIGDDLMVPGPASARLEALDAIRAGGGVIQGLTAEEGRLDEFYRSIVGGAS